MTERPELAPPTEFDRKFPLHSASYPCGCEWRKDAWFCDHHPDDSRHGEWCRPKPAGWSRCKVHS